MCVCVCVCGGGVVTAITSWPPSALVGSTPFSTSADSTLVFVLQTLVSILQGLHKGCWIVSLDLNEAYLDVPVQPSHWRYLWFAPQEPSRGAHCLSMEGCPLWLGHCHQRFYQILGACGGSFASAGMSHISLHQ